MSLTVTGPGGRNTCTKSDYITVSAPSVGGGTAGLVAGYGFNEPSGPQVLDASGNGNHGTLTNVTRSSEARFGGALSFNGTSSLVTVPDSASLDLTEGLTLTAWINPDRLNDRQPIVTKQGTSVSGAQRGFMFSAGDASGGGKLYFEVFASDTEGSSLTSTTRLTTGVWQHVAVTYRYVANGTSVIRLYIDGKEAGRHSAAVGPLQANPQPLDIGRYNWSSAYRRYLNGLVDEVRIYNRPLSQAEISAVSTQPFVK